CTTREFW
nr:immunoglobulin heavy chain junction region [Macaca mulatta]